jgi:hypothetical protein
MARLKLRNPQLHVPDHDLVERFHLVRMYLGLTRASYELAFPNRKTFGTDLETMLVLMSVFLGDAEGRPTTVTKIAAYCGLPRASIYRRLEELIKLKKIERFGHNYHLAEGAVTPDRQGKLIRIVDEFCQYERPKRTL